MCAKLSKGQLTAWLTLLKENANIGYFILDETGKILDVNHKILSIWEIVGEIEACIKNKTIEEIIKPVDSFSEILKEVQNIGHVYISEFPFITKDGSSKCGVLEGWVLQETEEGSITGWSLIDVTSICQKVKTEYIKIFEEVLNYVFKDIPLMFFLWEILEDGSTKVIGINKEGEEVVGCSSSELIGKDFLEFAIPEAWKNAVKKYIQEMKVNPNPYFGEHPLFTRRGEEVSVRWLDIPIKLPISNRLWVVSIGEDIRERKKLERELRESEERYRRMVEAITDYFYHVKIVDGNVVETIHSSGCEAVTGYTPEDFYNNPYLWYNMVYDEDKQAVLDFANALARGENRGPLVHRIIRKDGQIRWVRNICLLIYDKDGKLIGYDSLIRDVTEEIIAEEALKKSESFYRGIIEKLAEGYFEIDLEGKIRFANPSFLRIVNKPELKTVLNQNIIRFVSVEEQSKLLNLLEEIGEKKKGSGIYEWHVKSVGQEEKIVEASFFPILTPRGKVKGFTGLLRDVTERRKQEEHIQQLQKWESLAKIVGGIAHDFNNLLMVAMGHLDMEEAELSIEVDRFPYTVQLHHSEIKDAIEKAKELCRKMIIYAGKGYALERKIHNLNRIIGMLLPVFETMAVKNIEIKLNLSDEKVNIDCDDVLIREVILSLVTNSVEAMENKAGTITIHTRVVEYSRDEFSSFVLDGKDLPEGKYVELVVEDTGCGIEPKNLDKIFDPFFSTKFLGRGLGLASVLGIVRSHQGGMKVESKVGEGTKMYVVFPYIPPDTVVEEKQEEKVEETGKPKEVVLIVEEDGMVGSLAQRILATKEFDSIWVDKPIKALERINSPGYKVKILILNIGRDDKEARELLSKIREMKNKPAVILWSGLSTEEVYDEYKDLVTGRLRKPFLASEIINAVKANWR